MGCGVVTQAIKQAGGITPGINILEDISTDFVGAGVSVKVIPLMKGQEVVQHKHDYPHLSVLMSGVVVVITDDWHKELDASEKPVSIVIEPGIYHGLSAVTDAVWLCVHKEGLM